MTFGSSALFLRPKILNFTEIFFNEADELKKYFL
jgi:hypothetical protein